MGLPLHAERPSPLSGFGIASHVTLAKARELAKSARELSRQGVHIHATEKNNTASARAANAKAMTFRQCGDALIAIHERAWKSAKHRRAVAQHSRNVAYQLGDMVVDEIDTEHVLAVLEPIWLTKPETASASSGSDRDGSRLGEGARSSHG